MSDLNNINIAIFADGEVGNQTLDFLLKEYPSHVKHVCQNPKEDLYTKKNINILKNYNLDYIILAWWPQIIKKEIISIPSKGIINFHPSLLPYNRGKHYNFWTIVEECPYGVSLHFIDENIDSGDVLFQRKIEKTWEDTGETLYYKAQKAMIELFKESYPKIIANRYCRIKQKPNEGSFHYAKELEPACEIKLDKKYTGKEILNLLRARTFPPYPACYFYENNDKYEVRIEIKKVKDIE